MAWTWDVLAKSIGAGRRLILQFSNSTEFNFKLGTPLTDKVIVTGNTVIASVDIRDELGLTMAERTILTAIGTLIGLIGAILGYPFIKSRFEPAADSAATKEHQVGGRERSKQNKRR